MNYLTCNHCQHQNSVLTTRVVFCEHCGKKLNNNFIDWKITNSEQSFSLYVDKELAQEKIEVQSEQIKSAHKTTILQRVKHKEFTQSQRAVISFSVILLTFVLVYDFTSPEYIGAARKNYSEVLTKSITWNEVEISNDLKIMLPFETKYCETNIPGYLQAYVNNIKSRQSQSQPSFSVTIEEMSVMDNYSISTQEFLSIKDNYMNEDLTSYNYKNPLIHTTINSYKTTIESGSYNIEEDQYIYENYTLQKDSKIIKIIISYLSNNNLLEKYTTVVTASLYQNI